MGKIPVELKATIAKNIKACRSKMFPGRGGGKKCAESFGVSPQQWSPWERGMRTPDELRLKQIAEFFNVDVEFLRRDHDVKPLDMMPSLDGGYPPQPHQYGHLPGHVPGAPMLREPDAPPYGLPSLRRDESPVGLNNVAELSMVSSRLLKMICSTTQGVIDGKFDVGKSIVVLRRLGDILEQKLIEADNYSTHAPAVPVPPRTF